MGVVSKPSEFWSAATQAESVVVFSVRRISATAIAADIYVVATGHHLSVTLFRGHERRLPWWVSVRVPAPPDGGPRKRTRHIVLARRLETAIIGAVERFDPTLFAGGKA
jgi:hypothetical protein